MTDTNTNDARRAQLVQTLEIARQTAADCRENHEDAAKVSAQALEAAREALGDCHRVYPTDYASALKRVSRINLSATSFAATMNIVREACEAAGCAREEADGAIWKLERVESAMSEAADAIHAEAKAASELREADAAVTEAEQALAEHDTAFAAIPTPLDVATMFAATAADIAQQAEDAAREAREAADALVAAAANYAARAARATALAAEAADARKASEAADALVAARAAAARAAADAN